MYQTSDWIKALTQLSKLTVEGIVNWKPTELDDDELPEPTDRQGRAFVSTHKNRRYRIFEVKSRNYTDEDTYYWGTQYRLDIFIRRFGDNFEFITRSGDLPAVADLFRAVERKYAHQKGALDDLLGNDQEGSDD